MQYLERMGGAACIYGVFEGVVFDKDRGFCYNNEADRAGTEWAGQICKIISPLRRASKGSLNGGRKNE